MEEVEEANGATVDCCHRLLNQLSQPQGKVQYGNVVAETGEAVSKFKRVVTLLSNGLIHRRVRKHKKNSDSHPSEDILGEPSGSMQGGIFFKVFPALVNESPGKCNE